MAEFSPCSFITESRRATLAMGSTNDRPGNIVDSSLTEILRSTLAAVGWDEGKLYCEDPAKKGLRLTASVDKYNQSISEERSEAFEQPSGVATDGSTPTVTMPSFSALSGEQRLPHVISLRIDGRLIGVVTGRPSIPCRSSIDAKVLKAVCQIAAIAVQKSLYAWQTHWPTAAKPSGRAENRLSTSDDGLDDQLRRMMKTSCKLSRIMSLELHADAMLGVCLDAISWFAGSETSTVAVGLFDDEQKSLKVVCVRGIGHRKFEGLSIPLNGLPPSVNVKSDARSGPWFIGEPSCGPVYLKALPGFDNRYRTIAVFPLATGRRVIGVLLVSCTDPIVFSADEIEMLEAWVRDIGMGLSNCGEKNLFTAVADRASGEKRLLQRILRQENMYRPPPELYHDVLSATAEVSGVDEAEIWEQETSSGQFKCSARHECQWQNRSLGAKYRTRGPKMLPPLVEEGRPLIVDDVANLKPASPEERLMRSYRARSCMILPILGWRKKIVGALYLGSAMPRLFAPSDIMLAQAVAGHLASVMQAERRRQAASQVVENIDEGVILFDKLGKASFCNGIAATMFGLTTDSILGASYGEFKNMVSSSCPSFGAGLPQQDVLLSGGDCPATVLANRGVEGKVIEYSIIPLSKTEGIGTGLLFKYPNPEDRASRSKSNIH